MSVIRNMMMAAALALWPAAAMALEEGACAPNWSMAAEIVRAEGLAPIASVTSKAAGRIDGEVVKATLCRSGDRYVYRLVVRKSGGGHTTLVVDALKPFEEK